MADKPMNPSGYFFAWVIINHKRKTTILMNVIKIAHIPLQGAPYPAKFAN